MKAKSGTRLSRSRAGDISIMIVLLLVCVFMSFPLVYLVVQAFKPLNEIFIYPPRFFVKNPTLDNFRLVGQLVQNSWVPMSRYIFNSVFIAVVGTVASVIISALAAYPLSKHRFPGKAFYSLLIVVMLLFRSEVTSIPSYVIIAKLGMVDTHWALLLPALAGTFGVFLMQSFMGQIPDSILEAARIDGASEYTIFWHVVMPAVKPAWLTLTLFSFQAMWNTTGTQYIYSEENKLLPVVLQQLASGGIARSGAGSAVALLLAIPPIAVFIVSQSSVIETMSHSGLK